MKDAAEILVVEDEPVVRDLLLRMFPSDRFHLVFSDSVHTGLGRLLERDFDLLISDLRLPDGNGIEVIRAFSTAHARRPVLVITGSLTPEERLEQVSDVPIFECVFKPFEIKPFRIAVDEALRSAHEPR